MQRLLITGASGGMGAVCVEMAASEGYQLVLADLPGARLDELVSKLESQGVEVLSCPIDITNADSLAEMSQLISEGERLDGVIHTVGVSPQMADWQQMIAVDLIGAVNFLETV